MLLRVSFCHRQVNRYYWWHHFATDRWTGVTDGVIFATDKWIDITEGVILPPTGEQVLLTVSFSADMWMGVTDGDVILPLTCEWVLLMMVSFCHWHVTGCYWWWCHFARSVIGPMLNSSLEGYYSNFWGAMTEKVFLSFSFGKVFTLFSSGESWQERVLFYSHLESHVRKCGHFVYFKVAIWCILEDIIFKVQHVGKSHKLKLAEIKIDSVLFGYKLC